MYSHTAGRIIQLFELLFSSRPIQGENLDEAKVASYTLPDPLKAANGKTITSAKEWTNFQRPRLLQMFREHVYGKFPGKPKGLHFRVNSVDNEALGESDPEAGNHIFYQRN